MQESSSHFQRTWKVKEPENQTDFQAQIVQLSQKTNLSPVTLQICFQRGLKTQEEIQKFLFPRLEDLSDPFLIHGMDQSVKRVLSAWKRREKIRVHGDYDVDGTASTALLGWFFRECNLDVQLRQPDRFKDGYGLSVDAILDAHEAGVSLLITVDCGITSFDAIEKANELGIDVVVIDHHQVDPNRGVPKAYSIINPHQKECRSGRTELCGCGLAFTFLRALRTKANEEGMFEEFQPPNLKLHLDLVVLATAADMVPLIGENHILVRHGLEVLKYTKKPGLRAMLEAAGSHQRELTPGHLGFVLAPRINASGRMGSASLALNLLLAKEEVQAKELATELEKINQDRMNLQNQIWDDVKKTVEEGIEKNLYPHAVVVGNPSWHEGVVGIVATRVTEVFHKPAIVLGGGEHGAKGSCRSFSGKNVLEGLQECSDLLLGFGGHKHAAGVSLEFDRIEEFNQKFNKAIEKQEKELPKEKVSFADLKCTLQDLPLPTVLELERLGPFGPGNPEPLVILEAKALGLRTLKDRHYKFTLQDQTHSSEAIWFHGIEFMKEDELLEEEKKSWILSPEINRYRGLTKTSFRIKGSVQSLE